MTRTCIDLCSGLGGFSESFLRRGWEVVRIDNDPRFKDVPHTRIKDIRQWAEWVKMLYDKQGYRLLTPNDHDVVLASPPCQCFSVASLSKYWDDHIPKIPATVDAIRLVMYCLDLIDYIKPQWWILENPRGMLRHVLGMPKATTFFASWGSLSYKPTDLWGNLPPGLKFPKPENWEKVPRGSQNRSKMAGSRDPGVKAKIPYALSEAICLACERELGA